MNTTLHAIKPKIYKKKLVKFTSTSEVYVYNIRRESLERMKLDLCF